MFDKEAYGIMEENDMIPSFDTRHFLSILARYRTHGIETKNTWIERKVSILYWYR